MSVGERCYTCFDLSGPLNFPLLGAEGFIEGRGSLRGPFPLCLEHAGVGGHRPSHCTSAPGAFSASDTLPSCEQTPRCGYSCVSLPLRS